MHGAGENLSRQKSAHLAATIAADTASVGQPQAGEGVWSYRNHHSSLLFHFWGESELGKLAKPSFQMGRQRIHEIPLMCHGASMEVHVKGWSGAAITKCRCPYDNCGHLVKPMMHVAKPSKM